MKTNRAFQNMIKTMRVALPVIAPLILLLVYLVSAAAGAIFLADLMGSMAYGVPVAIAISLSIQITRAVLVFFPQMNPNRPTFSYAGEYIAVAFGIVSIVEIINLVMAAQLSSAVYISTGLLMVAGIIIEIMLLREVRYATERELMDNPEEMEKLIEFHQRRAELQLHLEQMDDARQNGALPPPTPNRSLPKGKEEITVIGENGKPVTIPIAELLQAYMEKNGSGSPLDLTT